MLNRESVARVDIAMNGGHLRVDLPNIHHVHRLAWCLIFWQPDPYREISIGTLGVIRFMTGV